MKYETVSELLAWQPPQIPPIIGSGLLYPGSRAIVFGKWGTYKSMLAMHLGFCLTSGMPWLGFDTQKCSAMMVQVEITKVRFRERVEKYTRATKSGYVPQELYFVTEHYLRLDKEHSMRELRLMLTVLKPKVLILDPFYRMFSGDISDNFQVQNALDKIDEITLGDKDLAVVLVGHTRKLDNDPEKIAYRDWGQELIGGSYIMNWCDTAIAVEQTGEIDLNLHFVKARHSADNLPNLPVRFNRETLRFGRIL